MPPAGSAESAGPDKPSEPAAEPSSASAEDPADETSSPQAPGQTPYRKLRRLAGELDTKSNELVDKYKVFLSKKENRGAQLTASDERLKEDLEAFQRVAETFDRQFQVGRWGRKPGHKADDQARIGQRFRELAALGGQVERLIGEVHPGPEVHQAWAEVRRRWKRVGLIVAGM
jgi:hypothetical protein